MLTKRKTPPCAGQETAPNIRKVQPKCQILAKDSTSVLGEKGAFANGPIEPHTMVKRFNGGNSIISWENCMSCKRMKGKWDWKCDDEMSTITSRICSNIAREDIPLNIADAIIATFCCTYCDVIHESSPDRLPLSNTLTVQGDPSHVRSSVLLVLDKFGYNSKGEVVFQCDNAIKPWNEKLRSINEVPKGCKGNCALVFWKSAKKPDRSTLAILSTTRIGAEEELLLDSYGPNYERRDYQPFLSNNNGYEYQVVENYWVKTWYGPLFSQQFDRTDVGKKITIENGRATVDGKIRHVRWNAVQHEDCEGTIAEVESWERGKIVLTCGKVFENGDGDVGKDVDICGSRVMIDRQTFYVKWPTGQTYNCNGKVVSASCTGVQLMNGHQSLLIPNPCDSITEPRRLHGWERPEATEKNAIGSLARWANKEGFAMPIV